MTAAPPGEGRPASGRWLGLDALRGLSIAAMILVNNPGRWGAKWQYAPLRHADWHGCTFTDLVFPTFLFCAGVAIAPALGKQLARGAPRSALAGRIVRRVLVLILLGLLLSSFPFYSAAGTTFEEHFARVLGVRFPGVLQRIGVCYGIAALLFLFASVAVQRSVLVLALLGYHALVALVAAPGVGAPDIDVPANTLQAAVDQWVFGEHIWRGSKVYDPEGLLSTIPALATCLLGVEAGRLLARGAGAAVLALGGSALMAIGWLWSYGLPFNKPIWTSSYAVWTAGIAMLLLGGLHAMARSGVAARLLQPLQVYGVNALLVFVGSGLLGRIVGGLVTVQYRDRTVSLKDWFFECALLSWADPQVASLLFALLWVLSWYLVLRVLYRRGIVWKV